MKILVVGDDSVKIDMIKKSLAYLNAEITVIYKGLEALMDMLVNDYDYMITDLHFCWKDLENEMDCGIHLLKEMQESNIILPTIICSSRKCEVNYDNVIGYIVYTGIDMEVKFRMYINM